MAILAECPICHRKQATKNKVCKCGENLDRAKRNKKVKYWINYRLPDGKQKSEAVSTFEDLDATSITDAKDALAQRKVQKKEKKIFDVLSDTDLTFEQLADWYLGLKRVQKLETYKSGRIQIALNNFNATFGSRNLSDVNNIDLEDYQENRLEQGMSPATVDMELTIAKTMVTKAFNAGKLKIDEREIKIDGDLLRAFNSIERKLVKGSNARERKVTLAEYVRLLNKAQTHLKGMLITAMNTGMRPGEIKALKWQYIDRDKMFIRLPAGVTKEGKKTGRGKGIPINYNVKEVLDSQPRALHHDYVFTYKGKPIEGPQGVRKSFNTACEKAKIPFGKKTHRGLIFHDFRRSVKTYMVEAGVDKVYRDTILGHSLKGMDLHYIKPSDEALSAAMDKYTHWLDDQIAVELKNVYQIVDQAEEN